MRDPSPGNRGALTGVHTVMVISLVARLRVPHTRANDLLLRNCAVYLARHSQYRNRSLEEYDTDE